MDFDESGRVCNRPWGPESELRYSENVILAAPEECQTGLREFARWLVEVRGLAQSSVTVRLGSARYFAAWLLTKEESLVAAFAALNARAIEDFFVGYCSDHGVGARRSMQAALRLLLRFAASRSWCSDLVGAVPSIRTYGLSRIPRGLSDADVRKLLASLSDDGVSARDRAIILMLATYGPRRGQMSGLDLFDIDWRSRRVTFAPHKGGLSVAHILTPLIAESITLYLRDERPASDEVAVFLRQWPPHRRLSPSAITMVVKTHLARAEIVSTPAGPHALRHAFATRLLRAGESFKTIADLLGHQSLTTTAVYAKVDTRRLSELAIPWPEALS